jgi:hypothetical protein
VARMKNVVITAFGDDSKLAVAARELPDPDPGAGGVQLTVEYSIVSGSDVNKFFGLTRTSGTFAPDLELQFQWPRDGKIAFPIKAIFGLDAIPQAHRAYADGGGDGFYHP